MTVHASKGLEFDIVYITGLKKDCSPIKNLTRRWMRRERTDLLRALTRADNNHLSLCGNAHDVRYTRDNHHHHPSLKDITPEHRIDIHAAEKKEVPKQRAVFLG